MNAISNGSLSILKESRVQTTFFFSPQIYKTGILVKECQEKEIGNVMEEERKYTENTPLSSLFPCLFILFSFTSVIPLQREEQIT